MDKALGCHAGDLGLNPDITKVYSAPILSGTPSLCALSLSLTHTMLGIMCSGMNICHREGEKRRIIVKSLQRHL